MHFDLRPSAKYPGELRERFKRQGWHNVVAFQTRNPMHRAHQELTFRAAQSSEANLLIHPVVGMTKPGDIDHYSRVRCYEKLLKQYPEQTTALSLLPLAMRMGGPSEALWHAIIRKNYGCTHFIVGRDHAGPETTARISPSTALTRPRTLLKSIEEEIGMEMVPFRMMVYVEDRAGYMPIDEVSRRSEDAKYLRHGISPPSDGGSRDPRLVQLPRGGRRTQEDAPSEARAGLYDILYRPLGRGQGDHSQRP